MMRLLWRVESKIPFLSWPIHPLVFHPLPWLGMQCGGERLLDFYKGAKDDGVSKYGVFCRKKGFIQMPGIGLRSGRV